MAFLVRMMNNATAEYQARYAKPALRLVMNRDNRADTIEAILEALLPFNFQLANMDVATEGGVMTQKVAFRLPEQNINFQFGPEFCTFIKQGASWATSEQDLAVLGAAEHALLSERNLEISTRSLTISMHLQLLDTRLEEVMDRFMPPPFAGRPGGPPVEEEYKPTSHAVVVNWHEGSVLVDKSNFGADTLHVRLITESKGSIRQLFTKFYRDGMHVFNVLNVLEASRNPAPRLP